MASALINAGQAQMALGAFPEAEKMFLQALEIDPKDAAAANQMGELCVKRQRDSEARRWFQQAIAARRDYAPAIDSLASLYMRAGQPNDATAALRYGIRSGAPERNRFLPQPWLVSMSPWTIAILLVRRLSVCWRVRLPVNWRYGLCANWIAVRMGRCFLSSRSPRPNKRR